MQDGGGVWGGMGVVSLRMDLFHTSATKGRHQCFQQKVTGFQSGGQAILV